MGGSIGSLIVPGEGSNVRIRMDLAYDGTRFSGWAKQPGLRTVQETVEQAWGTVLRTQPPVLTVGGRTDAGVHARGSVAHLDIAEQAWLGIPGRTQRTPEHSARARLTGLLPSDIVVRSVHRAPNGFDARFSALLRRYTYRLCDRPATADPLRRFDTVRYKQTLDVAAMNQAAQMLLGLHNFAAFCRKREGATTIRTLLRFEASRTADGTVVATVEADAFCHSMVRALVGAIVKVGIGQFPHEWPATVLAAEQRHPAVTVMPAHGLCLEEIVYPAEDHMAARAEEARARRD
ncbi:MAG: tRNA pseudouridine(38-40) synthase TruA [Ornithinimicrobium sp.]